MHLLATRTAIVTALLLTSSLAAAQGWEESESAAEPTLEPAAPAPAPEAAPAAAPPAAAPAAAPAPAAQTSGSAGPVIVVNTEPPPAKLPKASRRTHDGFYLRFSLGTSTMATRFTEGLLEHDRMAGGGGGMELMLGGTPSKGLVLGGGLIGNGFSSRDVRCPKAETPTSVGVCTGGAQAADEDSGIHVGMLGPFVDYYPDPKRGLHFGGMLGLAGMVIATPGIEDDEKGAGGGGGVGLWVGYDWWVAREWSLGVNARYLGVAVENPDYEWEGAADSFTLSFSVLFN